MDDSPPTFSVIIAAYQAAGFVGEAIESALEQEPPPLEIIVGDDGSTDDLESALRPFGDAVRSVRIEHAGEGSAKNAAATLASGDFLAFLDADDRFLPGRLAALGAFARSHPEFDVITTDALLIYRGETLDRCYGVGHAFPTGDQRSAILRGNFVLGLCAVRRDRFAAVGGFDPTVAYTVDWELWMRLILSGSRVGFIPEPLAEYRLHDTNMSARRAAMSRGRLESLARAASRDDLSAAERAILEETRRSETARLQREELKEALVAGQVRRARRAAVRLLVEPRQSATTRVKALGSLVAPGRVSRRLQAEEQRSFVSVGERRLPR